MLSKGDQVKDFTLNDAHGQDVSLYTLLQEGPLIVYFYPADFTMHCTTEACQIRDIHDDIEEVGMRVIGISPQNTSSHLRFTNKHQLPFTLLCDTQKQAIRAFGVDGPMGFGVRRATFLLDQEGKILDSVVADVFVNNHVQFIKEIIDSHTQAQ